MGVMRSCELKHAITIEEPTETQDTTGQAAQDWVPFASTRAKVDTTTEFGRYAENVDGGSLQPSASVLFTMRYVTGLTEKMRINFRGDYYNITGIADIDARKAWQTVRAIRGLNDG